MIILVQIQYVVWDLYSVLVCFPFSRFSAEKTFLLIDFPFFPESPAGEGFPFSCPGGLGVTGRGRPWRDSA